MQALDRLDHVLALSPGRAERHGFEYYRHGTLSLFAALDSCAYELDDVREALRAGDVKRASRLSEHVYRLTPVEA